MVFAKFLRGHRFIKILKKPKAIVQGFFFGVRKNVLRKVIHLKVNEREIEWHLFQLHSASEYGVMSV